MTTIAIHQANFFPWYPFFQKMEQADLFVVLTSCQFEKGGYQNRFWMNDRWHTMSVGRGLFNINKKEYVSHFEDWRKIKENLRVYDLEEYNTLIGRNMAETNSSIIGVIKQKLNIRTDILYENDYGLKGTERLVDICKREGATKYLSGISGKKYLDLTLFEKAGIEIIFQDEATMVKKPIIEVIHCK